jgi:hypothetical protein
MSDEGFCHYCRKANCECGDFDVPQQPTSPSIEDRVSLLERQVAVILCRGGYDTKRPIEDFLPGHPTAPASAPAKVCPRCHGTGWRKSGFGGDDLPCADCSSTPASAPEAKLKQLRNGEDVPADDLKEEK